MMKSDLTGEKTRSVSAKDRKTLELFKPVVDGIALFLGENCEVLLHSFENLDQSIIYIVNNHVTGRKPGSPITDLGIKILRESAGGDRDITGCYYSKTKTGKTLRSVTCLIRNEVRKPIGMLCINFDMNIPLIDILKCFNGSDIHEMSGTPENFVATIDDLVKTTLQDTISSINSHQQIPNHEKNRIIVNELLKKGIFDIKGAVDIVARELFLSRYTIYNYIRENKPVRGGKKKAPGLENGE